MLLKIWPPQKSRSIGLFTDLRLFSEALELAYEQGIITKQELVEDIPQRVKGLLFIESQSERGVEHLLRELRSFKWISFVHPSPKSMDNAKYCVTDEGKKAFELFKHSKRDFLRLLTTKMHDLYTIPGWFIHRLWAINPKGQGEVIIPIPPRDWRPESRKWEDKNWTDELATQTKKSLQLIKSVTTGAFPIEKDVWIGKVKEAWNRLSNLKRRKVAKSTNASQSEKKEKIKTYTPRRRLAMAMQEAAVKHLFSNEPPNSNARDFPKRREPLYPRTYMAWCPRLESLELIFYTDVHPLVPGRLIFPTSVFRTSAPKNKFEELNSIKNPHEETLWLHRPGWESMKELFFKVLTQEHQRAYTRLGSLYVPLLDVRDEVCRQLRLSAARFDNFMEKALRESLRPESKLSISVETDIREDQRSAHRLIRRPVLIGLVPHFLIAITEVRDVERIAQ